MSETTDLLQIKIEKAKAELPEETRRAIDAVDWKGAILGFREKKGYNFEQLGSLELETELLLAGMISPTNYPTELAKRMGISQEEANDLVNQINDLVFKKIRGELIKITEIANKNSGQELLSRSERPSIYPQKTNKPEEDKSAHPILAQKLTTGVKIPTVKTEHTLENITKISTLPQKPSQEPQNSTYKTDPYREIPD